ncbi:MAG: fatty acid desaturase [Cyclobacteriaceae bacterium]|nr:fatty acid desaturase [Cyclobacteriaceae bacterium]
METLNKSRVKHPIFESNIEDGNLIATLRSRVFRRIKALKKRENELIFKAFVFPLLYLAFYLFALSTANYLIFLLCYAFMGLMVVIIFLNLIHEVCHENLFSKKSFNHIYMLIFDILGANSFIWKKRHVIFHHNYPNVAGWDSDIEKSKFLKVHPNEKGKWLTKYQHYIIILYPFFLLNWFLVRDFRDFIKHILGEGKYGPISLVEYVKLFLFKFFFVGYVFLLPIYIAHFSVFEVILAGLLMFIFAGVFGLFVLLPPHVNVNNHFPLVGDNQTLPNSWLRHQLFTTNDLVEENWFTRYIMANFNFHIAHHLFPNISYLYAKEVTEEIKNFCIENGLVYKSISIWQAFRDHYKLIKSNSADESIWEQNM